MAEISRELIKYLTTLCRIRCTEEEEQTLLNDLDEILTYVEHLGAVDTKGVEPLIFVNDEMRDHLRDDVVADLLARDDYLSNAPSVGGMIRIPPVMKTNG